MKEFECEECKKSYKGKQAEEHVKKHLEAIIKGEKVKESNTSGHARGVLGMLMRNIPSRAEQFWLKIWTSMNSERYK